MKWYRFQTYILWPSSLVFYTLTYFMSGIMIDGIIVNDIPFDINYIDAIVNYLIPINILHSLLLIYLFHIKSSEFLLGLSIVSIADFLCADNNDEWTNILFSDGYYGDICSGYRHVEYYVD